MVTKYGFDYTGMPEKKKVGWMIEITYEKVKSQWKIADITTSTITRQNVINIASDETLKWFKAIGGSEKREMGFTQYGYLPRKVTSTSPDKTKKHVYELYYGDMGQIYKYHLAKYKMEREKEKMIGRR